VESACFLPVGDGGVEACWGCAHQVTEHETSFEEALRATCGCPAAEIYPRHYVEPAAEAN
jgi:hypothetical protein